MAKVGTVIAAEGIECAVVGSMKTFCSISSSVPARVAKVFGAASGVIRNVKCAALACNVAINLVIEAGFFTIEAVRAYFKYKSGDISRDEFRRHLSKHGCESIGGVIGGTALGILGELLVPIPLLGGIVGCTLGSLIGRFIGAIVGKKLGAVASKKDCPAKVVT